MLSQIASIHVRYHHFWTAQSFHKQWFLINFLFNEIFFDRVVDFAKVRPLFPTASQGCRGWSRFVGRGAVFLSGRR
jgi:hypothetical protein